MPIINPPVPSDGDTASASTVDDPLNAILALLNGGLDTDNFADGGIQLGDLAAALQAFLVPVATIIPYAGQTEPTGWFFCYGQSLLRSSYPALYAALGTNFGSADGTHFNVPDLRGRIAVGRPNMGGSAASRIEHSTTITTTNATNTATVASNSGLAIGMFIISTNVPAGTTITDISGTTITMSGNATATSSGTAARFSFLGNDPETLGASGGVDAHSFNKKELPTNLGGKVFQGEATWDGSSQFGSGTGIQLKGIVPDNSGLPLGIVQPSLVTNYLIKS